MASFGRSSSFDIATSAMTHDFRYVTPTRKRSMTYNFPRAHRNSPPRSPPPGMPPLLCSLLQIYHPIASVINLRGQQILKCAMMQGNENSKNTCHYLELYSASRRRELQLMNHHKRSDVFAPLQSEVTTHKSDRFIILILIKLSIFRK